MNEHTNPSRPIGVAVVGDGRQLQPDSLRLVLAERLGRLGGLRGDRVHGFDTPEEALALLERWLPRHARAMEQARR